MTHPPTHSRVPERSDRDQALRAPHRQVSASQMARAWGFRDTCFARSCPLEDGDESTPRPSP